MTDYSTIPLSDSTRARYTRDSRRLHLIVQRPEETFDLEYFQDTENIPAIRMAIDGLEVGTARKREYIRTICSILRVLRIPHREYLYLLKEYREEGPQERERAAETILETVMNDVNKDKTVRVLCILLHYGVSCDISGLLKARLDTDRGCLITDKGLIPLPAGCLAALQDMMPLCSTDSISTISRRFKAQTGHNYSEFKKGSNTASEKAESAETEAAHNCQETDCYYHDWAALDIVAIHKDNIRYLCKRLNVCHCRYNWTYFNQEETLQLIRQLTDIADNTRINYLTALCVIMERTAGRLYSEYSIYRQELILQTSKDNLRREISWFPNIYKDIVKLVSDKSVNSSIRVLTLLITDNVRESGDEIMVADVRTETGILRPSDLVNTQLGAADNGVESYISLDEGYWLIREDFTKNREERRLALSASLVAGIRDIYGDVLPKYLIVAKDGERYKGALSSMFEEYIGYGFDEVRASYFTWRERVTPTERRMELLELCRRQGHQYSTAMMNYRRVPTS